MLTIKVQKMQPWKSWTHQ